MQNLFFMFAYRKANIYPKPSDINSCLILIMAIRPIAVFGL